MENTVPTIKEMLAAMRWSEGGELKPLVFYASSDRAADLATKAGITVHRCDEIPEQSK